VGERTRYNATRLSFPVLYSEGKMLEKREFKELNDELVRTLKTMMKDLETLKDVDIQYFQLLLIILCNAQLGGQRREVILEMNSNNFRIVDGTFRYYLGVEKTIRTTAEIIIPYSWDLNNSLD